jgi:hypothetical protein
MRVSGNRDKMFLPDDYSPQRFTSYTGTKEFRRKADSEPVDVIGSSRNLGAEVRLSCPLAAARQSAIATDFTRRSPSEIQRRSSSPDETLATRNDGCRHVRDARSLSGRYSYSNAAGNAELGASRAVVRFKLDVAGRHRLARDDFQTRIVPKSVLDQAIFQRMETND